MVAVYGQADQRDPTISLVDPDMRPVALCSTLTARIILEALLKRHTQHQRHFECGL